MASHEPSIHWMRHDKAMPLPGAPVYEQGPAAAAAAGLDEVRDIDPAGRLHAGVCRHRRQMPSHLQGTAQMDYGHIAHALQSRMTLGHGIR